MRILIVDDREVNRKLLRINLENAGFEILQAGDGVEALDILRKEKAAAIISDVLMPKMDGYRLCKAVREDPALADIPFIIYTSTYVSPGDEDIASRCGADRYMRKPAAAKDVIAAIRDLTAGKRVAKASALVPEQEILKEYNEVLIRKLEEKNLELEERSRSLAESEERFREVVENMRQVFFLKEAGAGRLLYVSPAFESLWGSHREVVYDRPGAWLDAVITEDRQRIAALLDGEGQGSEAECRLKTPEGLLRWIRISAFPIRDQSGVVYRVCGFAEDITALKKAESQLVQAQKMESIGRLAGGVAHDFNNLLTVILGLSELSLEVLPQGHELRQNLEEVIATGRRAARLTQQLLAFSRRQVFAPRVIDVNELLRNIEGLVGRLIGEDIRWAVKPASSPWPVLVDPNQLEQVIINLCVNARDALPKGGKLTLETANVSIDGDYPGGRSGVPAGDYLMLAVTDTGSGMTEEVKAHLFEPFFTTKKLGQGTGLGLATCYGIVKQSGGSISVYSELGKGTTFRVYLPRADKPAESLAPPRKTAETPRGTETILLAEDEPVLRRLTARMLRELGYSVLEAANPDEALRTAGEDKARKIRILVTDVVMPGGSGRHLAEALKAVRGDVKVLYTSGYPDQAIVHHGILDEGISFLPKPFTLADLGRKVREALDGSGARG